MASPSHPGKFDLQTICDALGGIAFKWFKIGIQLGIPHDKLMEFQGSPDPLSSVINYWLKNIAEPASSTSIVAMLKSKHVDEPGLAERISKDFCIQEGATPKSDSEIAAIAEADYDKESLQDEQANDDDNSSIVLSKPSPSNQQDKPDQEVERELKRVLNRNLEEIHAKYAAYVNHLRAAVQEREVSAKELQSYLGSLVATTQSSEGETLALLSDKKAQLKECNDVIDIFDFLTTECASFLNYNIFQHIQEYYGICSDEEVFKYPKHLKAYIKKHKISEFKKINPQLKHKIGSKKLTLKYDIETTCRLAKLTDLKILIADIMEISSLALEIVDIDDGCVIVTFLIPASIADALFTPDTVFTPQQEEKLRAASVLWMKCNGHTFHFDKKRLKEALQELLSCSICLDTYTDPKQLQCQHAYCQQCLMGLVQQGQPTLTCPTCREVTPVPANGVAGLPADFRANQLLEMIDKKSTAVKPPKVSAELVSNEAFTRCKESILESLQAIDHFLSKLDTCCDEISNQRSAIEKEIHTTIMSDDRKTELVSQLHQLTQIKLTSLAAQKDEIRTIQARLSEYLHCVGKDTTKVKQVKELTTTLKLDTPNAEADMQLLILPDCTVSGVYTMDEKIKELATVGAKSFASLRVINFSSWQHKEVVTCKLVSALKGTTTKGSIEKRGLNKYEISYQPTIKGVHQLHVKVEGQHIRGSPFHISAKSSVENLSTPILTIEGVTTPRSIAVNKRGEMVVAEYDKHCLTIVSPRGEIIRSFGSGQGKCELHPCSVAIDGEGDILVTDSENDCIQKLNFQGELLTSVGNYGNGPLKFYYPSGIAFNASNGRVYVVDRNCQIQILNADLSYFGMFGKRGKGQGELDGPCHLACDSTGNVYVTDIHHHNVQVFTADGEFVRVFGGPSKDKGELKEPYGIAIDSSDKVYVSNWETIFVFTAEGQFLNSFGSCGEKQGHFEPVGLAVSTSDVLYVCDQCNSCIKVF